MLHLLSKIWRLQERSSSRQRLHYLAATETSETELLTTRSTRHRGNRVPRDNHDVIANVRLTAYRVKGVYKQVVAPDTVCHPADVVIGIRGIGALGLLK
jgi:hypothetical protein